MRSTISLVIVAIVAVMTWRLTEDRTTVLIMLVWFGTLFTVVVSALSLGFVARMIQGSAGSTHRPAPPELAAGSTWTIQTQPSAALPSPSDTFTDSGRFALPSDLGHR